MGSKRLRILLVEDNPGDVRIIREIMEGNKDCEHDLDVCGSSSHALSLMDAKDFDVVLLDLSLPDAKGLEAIEKVFSRFPQVPIVVFTGLDDNEFAREALKQGAQDYLVKGHIDCFTLLKSVLYAIERNKTRIELKQSEARFKAIFDTARDSIFIKGKDLRYETVNPAMGKLFDTTPSLLVDKTDEELFGPEGAALVRKGDLLVLEGGTSENEHTLIVNGKTHIFHTVKVPLRDAKGEVTGVYGIARDITEKRNYLQRMIEAEKLASVGTLAYGIAHEFNNILSIIMANSELGHASTKVSQMKECLGIVLESAKRASGITRNLLVFGKKEKVRNEPMDPLEPLKSVLAITKGELKKSNIRVVTKFDRTYQVNCDSGELAEVFLNIVTNARDAMLPKGGILSVSVERRGEFNAVIFKDTGCGVPSDIRSKIFEPFVTSKGALGKSDIPGTGLGLFLAYGIINAYGGKIEVDSEEGKGSTFTILIPISKEKTIVKSEAVIGDKKLGRRKLKVLLIDDEKPILEVLGKFLEGKGHDVTTAMRGKEGIGLFRKGGFDLVVSDIILPDIDGVELIREVRSKDPAVKIIAITGYFFKDKELQARQAGADEILMKPFKTGQFYEAIARVVV